MWHLAGRNSTGEHGPTTPSRPHQASISWPSLPSASLSQQLRASRVAVRYQVPGRLVNPKSAWSPNNTPGPSWGQIWGRVPRQCHWSVAARARLSRLPIQSDRNQARGWIFCLAKPTDGSIKQPCQPPTNPSICATSMQTFTVLI